MEACVPMTLPKGIVTNTANIYKEVATYPTVPADKICEYWHVYTTTNKKLKDPTARRLENFWWLVWGSDRRFLSGRTLARLYEHISLGPTIAPLHGPPNRWEGPNAPSLTRQLVVAHLSKERHAQRDRVSPPPTKPADASVKSLSSSASKPPPPHPILKKPRDPSSSSGPRPTARFLSPPESANGDDKGGELPSSDSTATTGLEMPLPVSKKRPPTTKKFVAATAAARRRPVLPRKTSPQSPILTAAASRDGDSSAGSRAAALPRPVSPIPERTSNHAGHGAGAANEGSPQTKGLSAKALGKRPAAVPTTTADKAQLCNGLSSSSGSVAGQDAAADRGSATLPRPRSLASNASPWSSVVSETTASSVVGPSAIELRPAMVRSQSHTGYCRHSGRIHDRNHSQGLFTGATASTTNVAVQGTIIDQSGSLPAPSVLSPLPSQGSLPSRPSASSLLESRLTPTQPGSSASVPMGRTRSQLTLLLEREKARIGDKPRSRN